MILVHGKQTTTISYYEGDVASTKILYEVPLFTTKETLLKDMIEAMDVLTSGGTQKLELCIHIDSKGRYKLTKSWTA